MKCKKRRRCGKPPKVGYVFICLGAGMFLANVLPYYLLVTLFGIAIIGIGVWIVIKT